MDKYLMESPEEGRRLRKKTNTSKTISQMKITGLQKGMTAVDVGCGSGAATIEIAKIVYPAIVIGVDLSYERVMEAKQLAKKENIENVCFVIAETEYLPFKNECFDYSWNRFLFEYLKSPEKTLEELHRIAKKGGLVVTGDLDGNCLFHYPMDKTFEEKLNGIMKFISSFGFDPFVGRKLFSYYKQFDFSKITPFMYSHHLIAGEPDEQEKENWRMKINTLFQNISPHYENLDELKKLKDEFINIIESPDTFTYSPVIFMIGEK
jgi:ubiquinone/menaquinone biosynthesis C-methylase UbiE